jgi:pimeloyl-ACP methyl ester carboxylesterase
MALRRFVSEDAAVHASADLLTAGDGGTTLVAPRDPAVLPLAFDYVPMAGTTPATRAREHAIVLVHGMTSAAATFANVTHDLTAVAHVFAVDLRGHGRTAEPADCADDAEAFLAAFAIPRMARDVAHFVRTVVFAEHGVAAEVGSVHVLGHSWGARVVSALALDAASSGLVKSLMIEDEVMTALDLPPEQATEALAAAKLSRARGLWADSFPTEEAAVAFCGDAMQADPVANGYGRKVTLVPGKEEGSVQFKVLFKPHVAIAWNFHATTFDCRSVWDGSSFAGPVTVIGAARGAYSDAQKKSMTFEALCSQTRAPRRYATVNGSGHSVHRTHPTEFAALVRTYVAVAVEFGPSTS